MFVIRYNPIVLLMLFSFISCLKVQDNNDTLAYWLSNSSTLLLLLQRTLKASGAASLTPQRRRSSSASLFGRMSQVTSKHSFFLEIVVIYSAFRRAPYVKNSLMIWIPFFPKFSLGTSSISSSIWALISEWTIDGWIG